MSAELKMVARNRPFPLGLKILNPAMPPYYIFRSPAGFMSSSIVLSNEVSPVNPFAFLKAKEYSRAS